MLCPKVKQKAGNSIIGGWGISWEALGAPALRITKEAPTKKKKERERMKKTKEGEKKEKT